jgi:hypothetical protein
MTNIMFAATAMLSPTHEKIEIFKPSMLLSYERKKQDKKFKFPKHNEINRANETGKLDRRFAQNRM